jgi:hypothetical protein
MAMAALRSVDRYGVTDGREQYAGFKALPPAPAKPTAMTWEAASDVLLAAAGVVGANMANPEIAERVYRAAAKRHHPDRGGDRARWDEIDEAWRVIKS